MINGQPCYEGPFWSFNMAQEATKNPHLRHEVMFFFVRPAKKRPSREMGLRKHASCACPVFYCISVIYDFFPKAVEVGKILEAIEYQPFDGQPS